LKVWILIRVRDAAREPTQLKRANPIADSARLEV
jgi:hypothetical protein